MPEAHVGLSEINIAAELCDYPQESFLAPNPCVTNKDVLRIRGNDMKGPATGIHEVHQRTHAKQDIRVLSHRNFPGAVKPNG